MGTPLDIKVSTTSNGKIEIEFKDKEKGNILFALEFADVRSAQLFIDDLDKAAAMSELLQAKVFAEPSHG